MSHLLLRRIALVLGVLVLALLVAEWWVGRYFPVRSVNYRLDPELLHTTIPGSRRIQAMPLYAGGARNLIAINSRGYRGPELDAPKSRPRILVIGDSMVMSENVKREDTFPVRLSAHTGEEFEVVNGGVTGYGPDQTLLKLERELQALDPDVVVLVLCASNDFGDLMRNKLFLLGNGGRLVRTKPKLGADLQARFDEYQRIARKPALVRLWRFFRETRGEVEAWENREKPPYVREYLVGTEHEYVNHVVERDPVVPDNLFADYYDADLSITPDAPSAKYKRRLMEAVLGRMRDTLAERDIAFAVVVVPAAVDLYDDFDFDVDPEEWPTYDPTAISTAFGELLDRLGVPFLDLYGPFEEAGPAEHFEGAGDIHWNVRGIDLGARLTARLLDENDLLPR